MFEYCSCNEKENRFEVNRLGATSKVSANLSAVGYSLYGDCLDNFEIEKLQHTISYLTKEIEKYKDKKEKEYKEVVRALIERVKDCKDQLTVLLLSRSLKLQSKTI